MGILIKPKGENVLVKKLAPQERKTKGGIILPGETKGTHRNMVEGLIVEIGSGRRLADGTYGEFDFKEGDHVFFQEHGGMQVPINKAADPNQCYVILHYAEIMASIEEVPDDEATLTDGE